MKNRISRIVSGVLVALLGIVLGNAIGMSIDHAAGTAVVKAHTDTPTQKIKLLGDSITAGWLLAPEDRLQAELSQLLNIDPARITNNAVGGQALIGGPTGTSLSETWDAQIATLSPGDVVYVQIGTNDLFTYAGDYAWTSTYSGMITRAQALGLHVVIGLITPVGSDKWNVELLRQRLDQWLRDVYNASGLTVDYPALLNNKSTGQTWMEPRFGWSVNGTLDGIHVDEGGERVMARALAAHIQASGWFQP